jgi:uncharacterized protein (DUF58 family)
VAGSSKTQPTSQGQVTFTSASSPRPELDLEALMRIRSLELRARAVVEGLWRGLHRSPYHGFSVEFTEYRPYSPGDVVRFLVWRLYARSDRDYVKKYEDETNLRCQLVVDQSRSMSFGSGAASKAQYAATLAATLASFLFEQGDAVGVTTFAGGIGEHLPARNRPGHLRRLMGALERPAEGRQSAVGPTLEQVAELLRRRGMVVLISDLLVAPDQIERPLAALRAAGHELLVLEVQDPSERTFTLPLGAPTRLRDLETDAVIDVDPAVSRTAYLQALQAHQDRLQVICGRLGIERHVLGTDGSIAGALVGILASRGRRSLVRCRP